MSFSVLGNFYQRLLLLLPFAAESFNYDDPSKWPAEFPQCAGYKQSPISISTHKTIPIHCPPILFAFYDAFFEDYAQLHNNGHTVKMTVPQTTEGVQPFISGGLLEGIYHAQEVHFHWGSPKHKGSEHKLNGRRYDVEMHIVHKNSHYDTVEEAREHEDGLVVIGVLFKVVKSPNVFYPGLNTVYNSLRNLEHYNATTRTSQLITLGSLLGDINREEFFTYKGSLTTPPCSEAVTWIVFPEVIPISHFELPKFWRIRDTKGQLLINNFRPVQPITYRKVYHRMTRDTAQDIKYHQYCDQKYNEVAEIPAKITVESSFGSLYIHMPVLPIRVSDEAK